MDTASSGLVNALVTGYHITYNNGKPQIRVKLRSPEGGANERFLEELTYPLTIREKELMKCKQK